MENLRSNMSIACSVDHCKYHNAKESSCSLSSIKVGNCGPAKSSADCTECCSYKIDA